MMVRGISNPSGFIIPFCTNSWRHSRITSDTHAEFIIDKRIVRKWTHVRDSWSRSMKYGYDEVTKLPPKPYLYHNDLKFLQTILKPQNSDKNECKSSNIKSEDTFRESNGTQDSDIVLQYIEDNEVYEEIQANVCLKQEINTNSDQTKLPEEEEWEEWHIEIVPVTDGLEEEEKDENPEITKKKRSSIFVNTCKSKKNSMEKKVQPIGQNPAKENISFDENCSSNDSKSEDILVEQRHWNFFKAILPSVKTLNEDHVLQFQSDVISLLQKLRENQKLQLKANRLPSHSSFEGRGRKYNDVSFDDEDNDDLETFNKYAKKKLNRRTHQQIAVEYERIESEYLSND